MEPYDQDSEVQRPIHSEYLESWYSKSSDIVTISAGQDAFEEATRFFSNRLTKDECKRIWLQSKTSMKDIESVVQSARIRYEQATGKRSIQQWLKKLSSRIMYYGAVLDTLAQHHPEWVALAWGSFRFILVGVLNYEELVERIAEALSHIADVLPWTELSLQLYPTNRMKQIASQLYAYIISFFLHAMTWYKKRTISKALASLTKPYELQFKDTVTKIEYYAKAVDNTSTAASRAELRDMHLKLNTLTRKVDKIVQVSLRAQSLNQLIHHDLGEQKQMIYDLQLSHILSMIVIKHHPHDTLSLCQSIFNRRRRKCPDLINYSQHTHLSLNSWANSGTSSLLLLQPGPRAKAKVQGLTTTIIENLRARNKFVIWSLSTGNEVEISSEKLILEDLVSQALRLAAAGPYKAPASLRSASFQVAHAESEWLSLLSLILSCNQETFIVIEAEDLLQSIWKDREKARNFLGLFQAVVDRNDSTARVKMLIVNYDPSISTSPTLGSRCIVSTVDSSVLPRRCPVPRGRVRGRGRGRDLRNNITRILNNGGPQ